MEINKEDLVDYLDKITEELAKELGLELIKRDHPMKEENGSTHVTGTITFLNGESAKRAASIYGKHKGKT
jgi:hypothetical protein